MKYVVFFVVHIVDNRAKEPRLRPGKMNVKQRGEGVPESEMRRRSCTVPSCDIGVPGIVHKAVSDTFRIDRSTNSIKNSLRVLSFS